MLEQLPRQLILIEDNIKKIEDYYQGERLEDRESLARSNQDTFRSTGEDEIWNILTSYRQLRIDILKHITRGL